jgi:hypothetical protein
MASTMALASAIAAGEGGSAGLAPSEPMPRAAMQSAPGSDLVM